MRVCWIILLLCIGTECLGSGFIKVDLSEQTLSLFNNQSIQKTYHISSSKYGIGNKKGSLKTPLGEHQIVNKIGANAPIGTIFKGRQNTKKIAKINHRDSLKKDLVTTRILRLKGMEPGKNAGKNIDSYHRLIYIHGTTDEINIGTPTSRGCIRMKNMDIIDLFSRVKVGMRVLIVE